VDPMIGFQFHLDILYYIRYTRVTKQSHYFVKIIQ